MGSLYRSRHELVFVFKKGTAPHINNVELGRFGRNRSNVWEYGGQNVLNGTSKSKLSVLRRSLLPWCIKALHRCVDPVSDGAHVVRQRGEAVTYLVK